MPALFIYLIKVNVALLIFCAGYYAVLRHLTFYNLNRIYLLTAILFSTLYPLVNVSDFLNRHEQIARPIQVVVVNWQEPVQTIAKTFAGHDQWYWLQAAFWLGVCVFAIRLGIQLLSLYRLHKRSEPAQLHQYMIRVIKGDLNPFSFWKNIYINPDNHPPHELSAILEHEQIHVNEWHTLDILLGEISAICYWFNPGIWLMKRAIRENIEFITDQKILQKGVDSKAYQYSLLNVNFGAQQNTIVNHFNISTIKKRIMMMNAKRSSKVNITRYLFLIPAVMALLLVFSVSKAELRKAVKSSAHMMTTIKTDILNITLKTMEPISAKRGKAAILKAISVFNIETDTIKKSDAVKLTGKLITDTVHFADAHKFLLSLVKGNENNIWEGPHSNAYTLTIAASDTDVKKKFVIRGDRTDGTKADIYVNGVKVDNALDKINPEDINDIQVRGTKEVSPNGAIYITTKGHEPVKLMNVRIVGGRLDTNMLGGHSAVNHIPLTGPRPGLQYSGMNTYTLANGSQVTRATVNGKTVMIDTIINSKPKAGHDLNAVTVTGSGSNTFYFTSKSKPQKVSINGNIAIVKDQDIKMTAANGDTIYTAKVVVNGNIGRPGTIDTLLQKMNGWSVDANGKASKTTSMLHPGSAGSAGGGGSGGRAVYGQALTIKPAPISFANKLIIIDGKEATEKQLKKVSADKIDSVSNLTFEAAKALYGDKAKNGVVVITTKK